MASLDRALRKDLETTVKKARRVAEAGARKAVAQIGVRETEAPKHLSGEQRTLRNRIRAHGRQLGDRRDPKTGIQDTARLVQECAYEHWHRMLFARFLAETDLLIEPASGVAITLDEVQELARENTTDWLELASEYAERMLPQIFRKDDPVLQIALPPETRSEMEDLLKGLPKAVFDADDSLGWVYQFWQADRKDEVNKSEVKIGADELPAVTQLFTEDYMVLFLLHNTLGAWWAGKVLAINPDLATSAADEAELRAACKVGDTDWDQLRFVQDKSEDGADGCWRPAAGMFEGWPKAAKDLTVLDPCMGSGHFLVLALPILVAFRMAEEALSESAAVDAVLRDNLFGLEIDPRCTQIAAFNLAFAAWRKVGHRTLPQLNLACSGLAIGVTKAEWLKLAEKTVTAADPGAKRDLLGVEKNLLTVGLEERVKNGLAALYDLFAKAPWLGSLIDPRRASGDIFQEGFEKLEPLLTPILGATDTDDARELAVTAQGMAKAAKTFAQPFVLVMTNVPYLGRGKASKPIVDYCDTMFADAKQDLATVFIRRLIGWLQPLGSLLVVFPQNCFYQSNYDDFRKNILRSVQFNLLATLGEEAWQAFGKRGPQATLAVFTAVRPKADDTHFGIDATKIPGISKKIEHLRLSIPLQLKQSDYSENEGFRIVLAEGSNLSRNVRKIRAIAFASQGLKSGDDGRFIRYFHEVPTYKDWKFVQTTSSTNGFVGGLTKIIHWENDGQEIARRQGLKAWGHRGIAISQMRYVPTVLYSGEAFDSNVCAIAVRNDDLLPALVAFAHSGQLSSIAKEIEPGKKINNGTFEDIPFDVEHWRNVASAQFPNGLPHPDTDDPTQWIFGGHPRSAATPLQVATARLVGFRWPRQQGRQFVDCPPLGPDGLEEHSDPDGIVCLTALKGEAPAEQRLNALLADAFGEEWSAAKLASLLTEVGFAGRTLTDWLRDGFFTQHCDLFHQRPFIWHISDGRSDGFHALVNYHRLAAPNGEGRRTLEKLIYSYLGDWIDRQRAEQKAGTEGSDARLAHAEHLKLELVKILEGELPHDIFVRWKPLHQQPLGWDPDIDDGIRINIRPFITARTLNNRGTSACILRSGPKNLKWEKDGGKEPARDNADYPWFWGWDGLTVDFAGGETFDGNRWNNLHYSRATKQSARDRHRAAAGASS